MPGGWIREQFEGGHSGDRFRVGMPWELYFTRWGCLADGQWFPTTETFQLYLTSKGCHLTVGKQKVGVAE